MAKFQKSNNVSGSWAKADELVTVKRARIMDEARRVESQFEDRNGNPKFQTICKVRFEGKDGDFNVSLNRATVDALIDAFGEDSNTWIGKNLGVQTEKVQVAGKNMRAVYLIPDGYELGEDANKYTVILPTGQKHSVQPVEDMDFPPADNGEEVSEIPF